MCTLIEHRHIKLIKSDSRAIYNFTKKIIFKNKYCTIKLSIHHRFLKKYFHKNIKQHNCFQLVY